MIFLQSLFLSHVQDAFLCNVARVLALAHDEIVDIQFACRDMFLGTIFGRRWYRVLLYALILFDKICTVNDSFVASAETPREASSFCTCYTAFLLYHLALRKSFV